MNKPAPKEPSMDEILSSIRQIIADDDVAPAPHIDGFGLGEAVDDEDGSDTGGNEPLVLSTEQIVVEIATPVEPELVSFGAFAAAADNAAGDDEGASGADFLDPDDISFAADELAPVLAPVAPSRPAFGVPPRPVPAVASPPPSVARAAPMPDPELSADIAEELLEPATNAAVRANFARLNSLGIGNAGITIEQMMRDMLRPMLKEWLDEHLPTVVERMVEKEIARISRGVE